MFLKTEQFEYNGVSVTLSELSALQRIEHLALLKRRAEQAESCGNLQVSVEDLVRTGAFLVAMSLWHNHPQKTQSPSMNEAVMKIEQEVLTTWPADAIARAEDVVLCLSGMIEAVRPDTDITEVAKNNTLTDDDFSAGKSSTAPKANAGPFKVPDTLPDEKVLFLSDILPTAWQAVKNADIRQGSSVAIFGAGPVGLLCAACARLNGAEHIFTKKKRNCNTSKHAKTIRWLYKN